MLFESLIYTKYYEPKLLFSSLMHHINHMKKYTRSVLFAMNRYRLVSIKVFSAGNRYVICL